MRTGVPCNETRVFLVWKTSQGKPCSGPVLALYGIAVFQVFPSKQEYISSLYFLSVMRCSFAVQALLAPA